MTVETKARNASLEDLMPMLTRQHETKYDVVVPSSHLAYDDGRLVVLEGATQIDETGVWTRDAYLDPTEEFEQQLADRIEVPGRYLRKMRDADELGLLDHNVNVWMEHSERNWLVRGFREPDRVAGVARAFLSDRYQAIDHLDAVTATLDGIVQAGVAPSSLEVTGDLSPKRLRLKITAPEITAMAPAFLRGYRNPSTGESGPPVIAAGVVLGNSETGNAAFQIAPQVRIEICRNGMTRTEDALRKVHLGGQLSEGLIDWSAETRRANIELIRAQARDAVETFLSTDYIERVAFTLDEKGSKLLDRPHEVLEGIGKRLGYTDEERAGVLDMFIRGGDVRASGVVNAFTAFARDVEDPERAMSIEEEAFTILEMASA